MNEQEEKIESFQQFDDYIKKNKIGWCPVLCEWVIITKDKEEEEPFEDIESILSMQAYDCYTLEAHIKMCAEITEDIINAPLFKLRFTSLFFREFYEELSNYNYSI